MERLISSSSLPSGTTALRRPRFPFPASRSAARSFLPLPLLRRSSSAQQGPPPPSVSLVVPSASRRAFPLRCLGSTSGGTCPSAQSAPARESASPSLKKVAIVLVLILLSALTVTIIQPVLLPTAYATVESAAKNGGLIRGELLTSAWTGFFAGCLHTLSGPDHLAALAPLSIGRTRIESAIVGALWGCGHDAGQLVFGLLFLLLKDRLHIEVIRTWGTRVVGLTLVAIGAMGIREASEVPTPCVDLEDGECDVTEPLENAPAGKKKIGFATFATGIVHGLQPDALMMVLPALALPSRLAGAAFLGMFLVGTVIAMGSYTVFIGSFSRALKERIPRITEKLTWAASLLAISMGIAIFISQFFGFSLY